MRSERKPTKQKTLKTKKNPFFPRKTKEKTCGFFRSRSNKCMEQKETGSDSNAVVRKLNFYDLYIPERHQREQIADAFFFFFA